MGVDSLAALGPAAAPGQVGFRARFVEEDQSRRIKAGLLSPPDIRRARRMSGRSGSLARSVFFYM
jgi:hypothetical protein